MCKYESAIDGTLTLLDFAEMNDWLAVKYENEWRAQEAEKDK
jgi:hypothetical protein